MTTKIALRRPTSGSLRRSRTRLRRQLGLESLESRRVLAASIAGDVIHDLNADGVIDPGEPGQAAVRVYLDLNENGQLDTLGSYIEPDDVAPGDSLENALPGVTLLLVDKDNLALPNKEISSLISNFATTGQQVFGYDGSATIFHSAARLRVNFDEPVSSVAIDFAGSNELFDEIGRLQVYDAQDNLLQTVDTLGERAGEWSTLFASRAEGDIAYAVAYTYFEGGAGGGQGRLDSLRIDSEGSEPWTITDAQGEYRLQDLEAGTYQVREVRPAGFVQTLPADNGSREVSVVGDQSVVDEDFANRDSDPPGVVDDNRVTWVDTPTTIDVLANDVAGDFPIDPTTVQVEIDAVHGTTSIDALTGAVTYTPDAGFQGQDSFRYTAQDTDGVVSNEATVTITVSDSLPAWQNPDEPLDVDDDGAIVPLDALLIINELNEPQYGDPVTGALPPPPDPIPAYFDVNGDNFVAAIDALLIINYLNAAAGANASMAEAEAEPADAAPTEVATGEIAAALDTGSDSDTVAPAQPATCAQPTRPRSATEQPVLTPLEAPHSSSSLADFDADAVTDATSLDDELLSSIAEDLASV